MHFDLSFTPTPPPSLTLGDHSLDGVTTTMLLGVTVYNELSRGHHVAATVSSASYRLCMSPEIEVTWSSKIGTIHYLQKFILPRLT